MARGPLPSKKKRRTNAPTIPTTELDAGGRKGRPPKPPAAYNFRKPAAEWWKWAWSTPQACAWDSKGTLYVAARRAQLEDDLDALDNFDPFELENLLGLEENEVARELGFIIGRLKGLAGGRIAVVKEMRELEKVLGLTPKAMADLRWEIVDKSQSKAGEEGSRAKPKQKKAATGARARLTVVA